MLTKSARLALVLLAMTRAAAADGAVAGDVSVDGRIFAASPAYAGQARDDEVSVRVEPDFTYKTENAHHALALRPFYRLDPVDDQRSHADLRQARYDYSGEHFSFGAGVGTFSWGVLESYRPTDIMNQTDFVESYRGDAKLGLPFVQVGWLTEKWSFRLYYLPYFRERTFPGVRGRLRFAANVDTDGATFEPRLGAFFPSGAARVSYRGDNLDVNFGLLSGLSREPRFVAELTTGSVAPRYDLMQSASIDLQWAVGGFVLKGEGYARVLTTKLTPYGGGGIGADYMIPEAIAGADVALAIEYLQDFRPIDAPITLFKHDAFAGVRVAANDSGNTTINTGALVDVTDGTTFGRLDCTHSFGDHFRGSVDVNLFLGPQGTLAGSFRKDSYGGAHVAYYF